MYYVGKQLDVKNEMIQVPINLREIMEKFYKLLTFNIDS